MSQPTTPERQPMPDWLREIVTRPGVPGPLRTDRPTPLPLTMPVNTPEREKEPA